MTSLTSAPTDPITIAAVVDLLARDFVSLTGALRVESRFATQVSPTAVQDEFSRFKLWAGNIAAHRKGRRGLEYRLRDAAHLKAETHNLLEALSAALHNALEIVTGQRLPWEETASSDTDSDTDSESSSDGASDVELQGNTELKQLLASIKTVLSSLFRLSIAIRDPAPNSQSKSAITIDKSIYEHHDIQHVEEKYINCPKFLTQRLGRAISARRQYLSYREEHHQKLAKNIEKIGFENPTTQFTTNSTEATTVPGIERSNSNAVNVLDEGDDTASQTSYATSVNATIRVPSLPKEARNKEFYECPLCFLLVSIHTVVGWKQHVYRDLHPYCCTYEHCTIADRLYDSRKSWFAHELEAHRTSWQCIEGCGETFQQESDFATHVRKLHPDLATTQMFAALIRTSAKSAGLLERARCVLCGKEMTLRALQRHLGGHQQQLALFALPPNLDETEDDQNDKDGSMGVGQDEEELSDMSDAVDVDDRDEQVDALARDVTSDEGSALHRVTQACSAWNEYIREACEDFITRPPQDKSARKARYDDLMKIITHQIDDNLNWSRIASNAEQVLTIEIDEVTGRMRSVMSEYSITHQDANSSTGGDGTSASDSSEAHYPEVTAVGSAIIMDPFLHHADQNIKPDPDFSIPTVLDSTMSIMTDHTTTVTNDDLQTPAMPSHEYEHFKQQVGLPLGSIADPISPSPDTPIHIARSNSQSDESLFTEGINAQQSSSQASVKEDRPSRTIRGEKGTTRFKTDGLFEKQVVIELGYPFVEEDGALVITRALTSADIDELLALSRRHREDRTVNSEVGSKESERALDSAPAQVSISQIGEELHARDPPQMQSGGFTIPKVISNEPYQIKLSEQEGAEKTTHKEGDGFEEQQQRPEPETHSQSAEDVDPEVNMERLEREALSAATEHEEIGQRLNALKSDNEEMRHKSADEVEAERRRIVVMNEASLAHEEDKEELKKSQRVADEVRDQEVELEEEMRKRLAQFDFGHANFHSLVHQDLRETKDAASKISDDLIHHQPLYPKIHTQHLDVETLHYYDVPYEYDTNPDYIIVLREMNERETDVLFEHTRRHRLIPGTQEQYSLHQREM